TTMTTPDPSGGAQALPAASATTPGLSPAGARVPGGPTLPAPDPISLTRAITEVANELIAAPLPAMGAPSPSDASALSSPRPIPSPAAGAGAPTTPPTATASPATVAPAPAALAPVPASTS